MKILQFDRCKQALVSRLSSYYFSLQKKINPQVELYSASSSKLFFKDLVLNNLPKG